jgi:CRP-like cAMP-binding protein
MFLEVPDCFSCHCKGCSVLKSSNHELLSLINAKKNFFKCRQGQALIMEGMTLSEIYFIYQGKLKLEATGLYGKKQIKRFSKTGDVVGFRGLTEETVFASSVYALEDSFICSIPRDLFIEMLKSNSDLMFETLTFAIKELLRIDERMKNLTTMNVREKVAESLLCIHNAFGIVATGELGVILSRQEIAEVAMTTKEQVSKCLSEFEQEKKIAIIGKKISIINLEGLKQMIAKK